MKSPKLYRNSKEEAEIDQTPNPKTTDKICKVLINWHKKNKLGVNKAIVITEYLIEFFGNFVKTNGNIVIQHKAYMLYVEKRFDIKNSLFPGETKQEVFYDCSDNPTHITNREISFKYSPWILKLYRNHKVKSVEALAIAEYFLNYVKDYANIPRNESLDITVNVIGEKSIEFLVKHLDSFFKKYDISNAKLRMDILTMFMERHNPDMLESLEDDECYEDILEINGHSTNFLVEDLRMHFRGYEVNKEKREEILLVYISKYNLDKE